MSVALYQTGNFASCARVERFRTVRPCDPARIQAVESSVISTEQWFHKEERRLRAVVSGLLEQWG
jgi:hypothetical protein